MFGAARHRMMCFHGILLKMHAKGCPPADFYDACMVRGAKAHHLDREQGILLRVALDASWRGRLMRESAETPSPRKKIEFRAAHAKDELPCLSRSLSYLSQTPRRGRRMHACSCRQEARRACVRVHPCVCVSAKDYFSISAQAFTF